MSPDQTVAVISILVLMFILLVLSTALFAMFFSTWIQALLSGVPVMIVDLIAMKLRKTDIKAVVRALIVAKQGGVTIPCAEMEKAWIQGVDLEKVTLAMIQAKKRGIDVTFQEVLDAEMEDRLNDEGEREREARWEEIASR